jgi:hypothetical protein
MQLLLAGATLLVIVVSFVWWRAKRKALHVEVALRPPLDTAGCNELFISAARAACHLNAAESLVHGDSLVCVQGLATGSECELLLHEANIAAEVRRQVRNRAGAFSARQPRYRMPIENFLRGANLDLCDELLRRALVRVSSALPDLVAERLGDATEASLRRIVGNYTLQFSEGEPAINVYQQGGAFQPHEDKQRITVLLALTDAASGAFTGGGTAFWSADDTRPNDGRTQAAPPAATTTAAAPTTTPSAAAAAAIPAPAAGGAPTSATAAAAAAVPPTITVHTPAGTALVFSGVVTHGALPVVSGQRTVFVASFGPRGEPFRWTSRRTRLWRALRSAVRRVS